MKGLKCFMSVIGFVIGAVIGHFLKEPAFWVPSLIGAFVGLVLSFLGGEGIEVFGEAVSDFNFDD